MFKDRTPTRNRFCCLFIILAAVSVIFCYWSGLNYYLGEDLKRLGKSFEFPAIEARAKPYGDLLGTIMQDDLIKVERNTDNVSLSMTHPEEYTGIVAVRVKMIYGTNRPFVGVQSDFDRYFLTKPGWEVETLGYMTVTQSGVACMWLSKTEKTEYPESWAKYQVVYAIQVDYLEPVKTCRLG